MEVTSVDILTWATQAVLAVCVSAGITCFILLVLKDRQGDDDD